MTANRLYSKLNIFGVNLYNEITKTRWLQKRGRIFLNSSYLPHFYCELGIESFKRKKREKFNYCTFLRRFRINNIVVIETANPPPAIAAIIATISPNGSPSSAKYRMLSQTGEVSPAAF